MLVRVVIIEDFEILLQSFTEMIHAASPFEVVGTYRSCESALENFQDDDPDMMLVDVQLPGMSGIAGIRRFKELKPKVQPIVVTVHQDSKYVFDALCAGAVGYLTKNVSTAEVISALEQVLAGGAPMSTHIARKVANYFYTPKEQILTDRENEVLALLAKGESYATIAKTLYVSINTIKTHARNIYEKLQLNNKAELIKKYNK